MKKLISSYYGFQFFFSLLFWVPIFYEYQKRTGLTDAQIFEIQSIYYIVFCFLEIPTGIIADKWGYRRCLKIGAIILLLCNLLPIFAANYDGFLWHFLLLGLSRSFVSGASNSYLYEYLDQHGVSKDFKRIEGNARAFSLVGKVACWAAVGFLMEWHLTLPYWLTSVASFACIVYAFLLPSLTVKKAAESHLALPINNQFGEIMRIVFNSPTLILLMVQGVAIFVLGRVCQTNLFQPILSSKEFPLSSFGLLMALMTIFESIGSYWHGWLDRFVSPIMGVFILTIGLALSLIFLPNSGQVVTVLSFVVFSYLSGLVYPLQRQVINDAIKYPQYRATMLSVESIIDRAACAWFISLLGGSLKSNQLDHFIFLCAGSTVALMVLTYIGLHLAKTRAAGVPSTKQVL